MADMIPFAILCFFMAGVATGYTLACRKFRFDTERNRQQKIAEITDSLSRLERRR